MIIVVKNRKGIMHMKKKTAISYVVGSILVSIIAVIIVLNDYPVYAKQNELKYSKKSCDNAQDDIFIEFGESEYSKSVSQKKASEKLFVINAL